MESLKILATKKEDAKAMAAIDEENFSTPWSEKSFLNALEKDYTIYLSAFYKEMLIGYCGLWNGAGEGEITNVSVQKGVQGRKIGSRLMEELERKAKEAGIQKLVLEVRQSNQSAIHLYEACGFHHTGLRKNFYQKPEEDALIMIKELNRPDMQ